MDINQPKDDIIPEEGQGLIFTPMAKAIQNKVDQKVEVTDEEKVIVEEEKNKKMEDLIFPLYDALSVPVGQRYTLPNMGKTVYINYYETVCFCTVKRVGNAEDQSSLTEDEATSAKEHLPESNKVAA